MKHYPQIIGTVIFCVLKLAPAEVPATNPISSHEQMWLDHTQTAIRDWIATDNEGDQRMFTDIATALARIRGSDTDRQLLRQILKMGPPPVPSTNESIVSLSADQNLAHWKITQSRIYLALNETSEARRLLVEGRADIEKAGSVKLFMVKDWDFSRAILCEALICFRTTSDDDEAIKLDENGWLVRIAGRIGRDDLMDRLLDRDVELAKKQLSNGQEGPFSGVDYSRLVSDLVARKKTGLAKSILEQMKESKASRAAIYAAQAFYRSGDLSEGDQIISSNVNVENAGTALDVARNFDRKALQTRIIRETIDSDHADLSCIAELFRYSGALGDALLYQRCETRALQEMRRAMDRQHRYSPQLLAECQMLIAAGYANAGNEKAMLEAIGNANAIYKDDNLANSLGLPLVIEDLARLGRDASADQLVKQYYGNPGDADHVHYASACGHYRRSEWAQALVQAAKITHWRSKRSLVQSFSLHALIKSGKSAEAEAAFNSLKSAKDKAIIAITIADLINEKRPIGLQSEMYLDY